MLRISTIEDLIANSMNILEPSPIDSDQNEREDGKLSNITKLYFSFMVYFYFAMALQMPVFRKLQFYF